MWCPHCHAHFPSLTGIRHSAQYGLTENCMRCLLSPRHRRQVAVYALSLTQQQAPLLLDWGRARYLQHIKNALSVYHLFIRPISDMPVIYSVIEMGMPPLGHTNTTHGVAIHLATSGILHTYPSSDLSPSEWYGPYNLPTQPTPEDRPPEAASNTTQQHIVMIRYGMHQIQVSSAWLSVFLIVTSILRSHSTRTLALYSTSAWQPLAILCVTVQFLSAPHINIWLQGKFRLGALGRCPYAPSSLASAHRSYIYLGPY